MVVSYNKTLFFSPSTKPRGFMIQLDCIIFFNGLSLKPHADNNFHRLNHQRKNRRLAFLQAMQVDEALRLSLGITGGVGCTLEVAIN